MRHDHPKGEAVTSTGLDDPRIRFRVYIDQKLADETWVDASNPDVHALVDTISDRHVDLTLQAEADGKLWMIEMFDPAAPTDQAHSRWGTDPRGMVDPKPGTLP